MLTNDDKQNIMNEIVVLFEDYIVNNYLMIQNERFDEIIFQELYSILSLSYNKILDHQQLMEIKKIIYETLNICYRCIIPKRSYSKDLYIKKSFEKIKNRLEYLRNIPQPDQRTKEWYECRYNLLTASDFWKCFDTESNQNQIIYGKCKPLIVSDESETSINENSSLHWGQKYEPVSTALYEKMFDTEIEEFGCIPHSKYKFLGASPDGINVCEKSPLYGRLLEIKNPTSRVLTGIPKKDYWCQTQLQMEVCGLNECDLWETIFKEYENYNEYVNDGNDYNRCENGNYKGIILCFIINDKIIYKYPTLDISKQEYDKWEKDTILTYGENNWMKNIYWKLENYKKTLILRNKFWFNKILNHVTELWNTIIKERVDGYEHRAPKKRIKSNNDPKPEFQPKVCLIKLCDL